MSAEQAEQAEPAESVERADDRPLRGRRRDGSTPNNKSRTQLGPFLLFGVLPSHRRGEAAFVGRRIPRVPLFRVFRGINGKGGSGIPRPPSIRFSPCSADLS
jgi:hypothetical protein